MRGGLKSKIRGWVSHVQFGWFAEFGGLLSGKVLYWHICFDFDHRVSAVVDMGGTLLNRTLVHGGHRSESQLFDTIVL